MTYCCKTGLSLLFIFVITISGYSQKTIRGTITDAETGETLPSANIAIKDTYRGTISNRDGKYVLSIPDSLLPATVMVRYLGYHTEERSITGESETIQDFHLKPSVMEMEEIVVTGEDPAIRIMREVIERKQLWRKNLETYKAEAYNRQTVSNDTAIVMITETVSEAFWDKQKGHREVLKSRRQTANIEAGDNFAGVSYFPNFYDDNVEIAEFDLVGVTHPDALKYYDFELVDQENIDKQVVYEIRVIPSRKLQPLFEGTVWVLDEQYALLEVRLKPNDVVQFPAPIREFNTFYEQQFNNYGKEFWLPVDMRIEGDIKISMIGLEFPLIRFRQISQIKNYRVNVSLPDSLYRQDDLFAVDSATVNNDSLLVKAIEAVPLTESEEEAYATLDSTATLEKAFKPTGFLARFVEDEDESGSSGPGFLGKIPGSLTPRLRFNRVDELFAGAGYRLRPVKELELRADAGYSTGYDEPGYGAGFTYDLVRSRRFRYSLGFDYEAHTVTLYDSRLYTPGFTVLPNLLGETDYYDYFRSEGFRAFNRLELERSDLSATVGFSSKDHESLTVNTAYDILGRDRMPRVNPPVDEGRINALYFEAGYNLDEGYNFGVTGLDRIRLRVEHSAGWTGSDFDYTRYQGDVDWSVPTFYQRRFISNTLNFKLTAGTFSGDLPLQKFGVLDGSLNHFSTFGALKTLQDRPYLGEKYLMLNAEHNFSTIPFELLGFRKLADNNLGLIVFGGAGRTWVSDRRKEALLNSTGYLINEAEDIHWEAGVSLNGLFGLFRVDFAQRLDQPAFLINVSFVRIF